MEFDLFIILLLGVTNYVFMLAYKGYRDFLTSTTQPDSLFCYRETVHARFVLTIGEIAKIQYLTDSLIPGDIQILMDL